MSCRVLCSTGAFIGRVNKRDYHLVAQLANELPCDGFEFMMYEDWYGKLPGEISNYLMPLGFRFPSFHTEKLIGELISRNEPGDIEEAKRRYILNCEAACALGSQLLVLHLWGGTPSDGHIAVNFSCYPWLKETAKRYGLLLTIENVVCNHANPMTHLHELIKLDPEVAFTFDTKMASFHRQLDAIYLPESEPIRKRIGHVHIGDYNGGYMDWANLKCLQIGKGHIDFTRFFCMLKQNAYKGMLALEATAMSAEGIDTEGLCRSLYIMQDAFSTK